MAAGTAAQTVARQRSRQSHGLHAQALAGLYPLPRRWPHLPLEQCRRTGLARYCPRQKIMAVRRFRSRWAARRGDIQPDRHCQIEQCRRAGLVGRRPGPDRRSSRPQYRPATAVELAAALGTAKSGSLIVAAIAAVFTIGYVANLLGEDEDWLHELSIDMFPEDGRLWVYGVGEDGVTAFTEDGIENLRQIVVDERTAGSAPPSIKPAK